MPRSPVTASSRPTITTTMPAAQSGIRPIASSMIERGRDEQLVGKGIEQLADAGDVAAVVAAGEPAIEQVGERGDDEGPGHEAAAR